jgi:NAD(P)-dependent dehydrogenase (short-subunit alcohol dehydrogenase family)
VLEGKVAIVTGAGGGIGRETALLLASKGARVVVNDLGTSVKGEGQSSAPAAETARMIKDAGGEAAVSADSVATWKSAHRIVQTALDSFGRLDIVINNAGNVRWGAFCDLTEDDYRSIVSTHVDGTFFVSRAAAVEFQKQKSGVFVHTTSTSGLMGHYNQAHYCTAKSAIVGLSKAIALDMKPYNVRSNCVAPFAMTRMADSVLQRTPEAIARLERMKPAQNAQLSVALASAAAKDVNGQVFIVRGNEIFLAGQGFPVRSVHESTGWSPESIVEHALPALAIDFTPVSGFNDYFKWPIL